MYMKAVYTARQRIGSDLHDISLRTYEVYLFWLAGFAVSDTLDCYNDNIFFCYGHEECIKRK